MSTLLLRLSAPLQAWGVESKFDTRTTQRIPTKSGVIGMLAAALGRRRDEAVEDLQALRFGVRVDREGTLLIDFHMAHEQAFWKSGATAASHLTRRHYLADATFLVGLEGEDAVLLRLESALHKPAFPLFLGRRACPPAGRLVLGIRKNEGLMEAFRQTPWQVTPYAKQNLQCPSRLRVFADADTADTNAFAVRDVPLSFDQAYRRHGFRRVTETYCKPEAAVSADTTTHDAMQALEG